MLRLASIVLGFSALQGPLLAQYEPVAPFTWLPTFGPQPGVDGRIEVARVFDMGDGPKLYIAGTFTRIEGVPAHSIARYDGDAWQPLGEGLTGGAASVKAIELWDSGTGLELYVAGSFETAGGAPASHLAKFDGTDWFAVGAGVDLASTSDVAEVRALALFDFGDGPELVVGGKFDSAGGFPATHVARFDGANFTPLGSGFAGSQGVWCLEAADLGSGFELYAGGQVLVESDRNVQRWVGPDWIPLAGGPGGFGGPLVRDLLAFDDGSGAALYAGGSFSQLNGTGPAGDIARWDGSAWTAMGQPTAGDSPLLGVHTLATFDIGFGPRLLVGGRLGMLDGVFVDSVQAWDGSGWAVAGNTPNGTVSDLCAADLGQGSELLALGDFANTGLPDPIGVGGITRYEGGHWTTFLPVGDALGGGAVDVLGEHVVDGEPVLVAAGDFPSAGGLPVSGLAFWNGGQWTAPGQLPQGFTAEAFESFDDGLGASLYVGGFQQAADGSPQHVLRFDGTNWVPAGGDGPNGGVNSLCVFDVGSGPELYAAGSFTLAGGEAVDRVARFDGSAWQTLGPGLDLLTLDLEVFDDGSGEALYLVGADLNFSTSVDREVVRWDGQDFSAVGFTSSLFNPEPSEVAIFDDGHGDALYAAGSQPAGGAILARWNGTVWDYVGTDTTFASASTVRDLAVLDSPQGDQLFVAGSFDPDGGGQRPLILELVDNRWVDSGLGLDSWESALALRSVDLGTGPELFVGGEFGLSTAGDALLARLAQASVFPVAGCFGNPATLTSEPIAPLGGELILELATQAPMAGQALWFSGSSGVDVAGCGFVVPGLGESFLSGTLTLLAQSDLASGRADVELPVPTLPSLSGAQIWIQAAAVALPQVEVELSNGIFATLGD